MKAPVDYSVQVASKALPHAGEPDRARLIGPSGGQVGSGPARPARKHEQQQSCWSGMLVLGNGSWSTGMDWQDNASRPQQEEERDGAPPLKVVHDILIVILLIVVMFAMGCHITWEEVWQHVRKPVGVCIGMASQFVLLPLVAFILIQVLDLQALPAAGMLVLSCCPGGVTSNILAYFSDGDVSLSVAMTTFSTVMALGMMPFNMWLYGHHLDTGNLVIPYGKMAVSLAVLTTPVLLGMLTRWKLPKVAPYFTKAGSFAGFAIILCTQVMEMLIFPGIFSRIPWRMYVALATLPSAALLLAYTLAWLFRQTQRVRRTVAIECSIQNIGTALTVISLSFPFEVQGEVLLYPVLYAFPMLGICFFCCAVLGLYRKYRQSRQTPCSSASSAEEVSKGPVHLECGETVPEDAETEKLMLDYVGMKPLAVVVMRPPALKKVADS